LSDSSARRFIASLKDDSALPVHENAVFGMPFNGAGQNPTFNIASD
jgi:hypothetical protein